MPVNCNETSGYPLALQRSITLRESQRTEREGEAKIKESAYFSIPVLTSPTKDKGTLPLEPDSQILRCQRPRLRPQGNVSQHWEKRSPKMST